MTAPVFDAMPPELRERDNWILWRGKKVPYRATSPRRAAKSTDPKTWASFDTTRGAYRPNRDGGVGFALDGQGLTAIDIDHCDHADGLALLRELGCGYTEVSPSGDGLHGWGIYKGELPRHRGLYRGLNVEAYTAGRYMTMTGAVIDAGPLLPLRGLESVVANFSHYGTESPETQETPEDSAAPSPPSPPRVEVDIPEALIAECLPAGAGHRNAAIFDLARRCKHLYPNARATVFRPVVVAWFDLAVSRVRTTDFATSWADFLRAYEGARADAAGGVEAIFADLDAEPLPAGFPTYYNSDELAVLRMCSRLQRGNPGRPFFLACRTVEAVTGIGKNPAAAILRSMRAEGVLDLTEAGTTARANRYILKLPTEK